MDTATFDFGPQTGIVARLAADTPDARLGDPTPCPDYTVGVLLGHLTGLAFAFHDVARKIQGPATGTPPGDTVPVLPADWRQALPRALAELAEAWRDPAAWTGMTRAGGIDLPGAVAAAVAADELVVHGWDLARATGLPYVPDPAALDAAHAFLKAAEKDRGEGVFGPVVPVPGTAPLLDRAIGLSGRNPSWSPPREP
ncbi:MULTISPECIES: TIGR03086 family metal-binding protein [unclassified Streptomyces]|uniref:TIGR03086 family metal-binding protein n=1 Tax=unclassified Streptomyces TaxID=2593676 RepID=UPI001660BA64|nr:MULTISPECIES: TIGR03086 family metal-binding protein [unclassified Streptomyces]MBD0711476.1 TIGR03086 family protein [Streptomyces sp. CBMA291]MBD0716011.1 TIGR03086 family protein [Streptomyces sp. CBMA370]